MLAAIPPLTDKTPTLTLILRHPLVYKSRYRHVAVSMQGHVIIAAPIIIGPCLLKTILINYRWTGNTFKKMWTKDALLHYDERSRGAILIDGTIVQSAGLHNTINVITTVATSSLQV